MLKCLCPEHAGQKNAEIIKDGNEIRFQINDGLVRDYATNMVRKCYGIVDTSLNAAIVRLSGEHFLALSLQIMDESWREKVLNSISEKTKNEHQDSRKQKGPIRLFVDSFASSAGKQAGKKSVNLAFSVLTAGVSDVIDFINSVLEAKGSNGD